MKTKFYYQKNGLWLSSDPNSKKSIQPFVFVRQFYAPGYYEAYDTVMTYAEKSKISILWFKQKGNCGYPYLNRNYPMLESFCIYCNKKFNHIDPIPCTNEDCHADFVRRYAWQIIIKYGIKTFQCDNVV